MGLQLGRRLIFPNGHTPDHHHTMSTTHTPPNTAAAELRALANDILEWADANDLTQADLLKQHRALGDKDQLRSILAGKCDDPEHWLGNYKAVAAVIAPQGEQEADPLLEELSTAKAVRSQFTRLKLSRTAAKLLIVEGDAGSEPRGLHPRDRGQRGLG
jgi:hypothetical protein